jgi:predicted Zn finger-like uncharacterized protein
MAAVFGINGSRRSFERRVSTKESDPMPVITTCPECSAKMKVSDNAVGKQIKCPKCSQPFTVTAGSAAATSPTPAAAAKPQAAPVAPTPVAPDPLEHFSGMDSETEREKLVDDPDEVAPRKPKARRQPPTDFMALLNYQAFITPTFGIHVLFVLGAAYCIYTGYEALTAGIDFFKISSSVGMKVTFLGLTILVGGPILVRVMCETIMAIFRILETLKEK